MPPPEKTARSAHSACSPTFFPWHGAQLVHPERFHLLLHIKGYIVGASAYAEDPPCTFQIWTPSGVRCAKMSFACATMPLSSPRTIDSNPLQGGIGVLQRAYSEGCFFPNLSHWSVGETPFHFIHIGFLCLGSGAGTNLAGPACEGPPVFKRNRTMCELPPIRHQYAYFQMPGLS